MPKYRFKNSRGVESVHKMPAAEFEARVKDGKMTRGGKFFGGTETLTFVSVEGGGTTGCYSACWPLHSDAMGVNPDQIAQQMAYDATLGVPIDYDPSTGCAIYTGPEQRQRHCEAHGIFDRSAGYSDPQRGRNPIVLSEPAPSFSEMRG